MKLWKVEIAKLSKEVKNVERRRDECLKMINELLLSLVDSEAVRKVDGGGGGQQSSRTNNKVQKQLSHPVNQSLPLRAALSAATAIAKTAASTPLPTSISLPLLSPARIESTPPEQILNINVGVLGHVDTGKTSLVKTLSSVLSTAALDKSKQSRARGITLDLGFSAFLLPLPEHLRHDDGSHFHDGGCVTDGGCEVDADDNSKQATDTNKNSSNKPQQSKKETTTTEPPRNEKYELLQVTLVDCPGHASLIRTIIGGAQIIDMVLLVVDATKGMQTQTAECLVIAEMTTRNLIVVLNKIDMFPEGEREERLNEAERKMKMSLRGTKFEEAQMVGISACVGGEKFVMNGGATSRGLGDSSSITGTNNIHSLLSILQSQICLPHRDLIPSPDRFHFAVDHCFPIKGQGTVLTGTCLSGSCTPNDVIEFPTLATQKKVKGLQNFRRRAEIVRQGDRAGICVSNFDAKLMERGIVASPGTVKLIRGAIAVVRKVRFFKGGLMSGSKFHVSVGHATVMATVTFWGAREIFRGQVMANGDVSRREEKKNMESNNNSSNGGSSSNNPFGKSSLGGSADLAGLPRLKFDWNQDFLHQDKYLEVLPSPSEKENSKWNEEPKITTLSVQQQEDGTHGSSCSSNSLLPLLHWARLEFLTPVYCPMDSLVIGSRLDSEVNANACRLAFSGRLVERYDAKIDHGRLKSYTRKEKTGTVCRLGDAYRRSDDNHLVRYEVFGTNLFKKETNMVQFVGLLVETDHAGDVGIIQSSFGTSGKFRVNFPAGTEAREGDPLYLRFKRYANDPKKAIHQDGSLPTARTGSRVDLPVKKKKNKSASTKIISVNGNNAASPSSHVSSSESTMVAEDIKNDNHIFRDNTERTNATTVGEIVTLKGDLLENGKHSVAIVLGLFSMEDDIRQHKGRKVVTLPIIAANSTKEIGKEEEGIITGSFGKMGKCKVVFGEGIGSEAVGNRVKILGGYK